MSAGDVWALACGVLILALLVVDIFITVLHHWGGNGPLARRLARYIWAVAVFATQTLSSRQRRRVLAVVGPLLIPLAIAVWATLALIGFALLYLPWIPGAFHFGDPFSFESNLADAVYYSGVTLFTLGYGDLVPLSTPIRMLAVVEAGAGFAMVSLIITYFASVYGVYTAKSVSASSVFFQAGSTADAAQFVTNYMRETDDASLLAGEIGRLRDGVIQTNSDFSNYPVLNYFPAPRPEQSLMRLLFVLEDLATILDVVPHPESAGRIWCLGSRTGLHGAADQALRGLADVLLTAAQRRNLPESPPAEAAVWASRARDARNKLREVEIPVDAEATVIAEYIRRRRDWEPRLRACSAALGEDWSNVTGGL